MSKALKKIQKRLNGIDPIPYRVIRYGTGFSCLILFLSAVLFRQADSHHAREVATAVLDSGVWVFAESVIGALLMQTYAERHKKSED